ncbi:hypothetical protein [Bradyrhizobium sp. NBAIM08]|uniref:hypothetical protein n=1 Tax=Bradyrhizobium sp. NBAIM08 TaxID=2793815 RepID=UPI001CD204CF|nr:hypothetical protein [Bradyrhizobium sp. NBAIM08]MCA1474145.1 hypothetical protein [Bradyrhizobium sp. NBAIM08]
MAQKQTSGSPRQRRQASQRETGPGEDIRHRIAGLRGLPRDQLADAVFMLAMDAKRQSALLREAINRRVAVELNPSSAPGEDLATYLADEAGSILRHHTADAPSFFDALLQRSQDVCFTVDQAEAVALLAATLREQRIEGILEGLRLAGVLNEPHKDRHGGFGT